MNDQWCVARRPDGNVVADDFSHVQVPIHEPRDGEILLRTLYLNLAPVMRMYMSGKAIAGEVPLAIGDVVHGRGVAEVIASKHADYSVGDIVQGQIGWQTYKLSRATPAEKMRKVPDLGVPYSIALSALGMTGFSAYFGFVDCGRPKAGDVCVVSGAAGGVGSHVIQLAKIHGCKVIGIAGGEEKCRYIESLGCDASIDYKKDDIGARLDQLCPDGIDLYFDNVGGDTLAACLDRLAMYARIVLCGSISEYLLDKPYGLTNYTRLRATNSCMQGFFVYNYQDRFGEAEQKMGEWIAGGKLEATATIFNGFENMPASLAALYSGNNKGSALCRVRAGKYDDFEGSIND